MSAPKNRGPASAFASSNLVGTVNLRDYFAAAALQGMIATGKPWDTTDESRIPLTMQAGFAQAAYLFADGMLVERSKGGGK